MDLIQLIIGFIMFVLGMGYLFAPQLILRFNAFMRDVLFKDSTVLLSHRRVGTILLLLSFIILAITLKGRP